MIASERRFVVAIAHPLGPMIELGLQERLRRIAPHVEVRASTRSRPIDLDRGLREGRVDASIDWLAPKEGQFKSKLLFEDAMIALARKSHPAFRSPVSLKTLQKGAFVALRDGVLFRQDRGLGRPQFVVVTIALLQLPHARGVDPRQQSRRDLLNLVRGFVKRIRDCNRTCTE